MAMTQLEIYSNALENLEETQRMLNAETRAMHTSPDIKEAGRKSREIGRKIEWLRGEIDKLQKGV